MIHNQQTLTDGLKLILNWYTKIYEPNDDIYLDVRINERNGDQEVYIGCLQFDTDHRGNWAYNTIYIGMTDDDLSSVAKDLLSDLEDDKFMSPITWQTWSVKLSYRDSREREDNC